MPAKSQGRSRVGRVSPWFGWKPPAGRRFPSRTSPGSWTSGLQFLPHTLATPVGSVVQFLNSDKVAHNIFWPAISGNKKLFHSLGTWPQGQTKSFRFDTPGVVPLLCNVHPEMSGYIVVTPTPYYAETDLSDNFNIAGVPDGSYTVTAWHESLKNQSKPVTVAGTVTVTFTLSK